MRVAVIGIVVGCAVLVGACGSSDKRRYDLTTPKPDRSAIDKATPTVDPDAKPAKTPKPRAGELKPTQRDAQRFAGVISEWAKDLRAGDVPAASKTFTLPAIVDNLTGAITLTQRGEVDAFNQSLPCGAKLTKVTPSGRYVVATFKLVNGKTKCKGTAAVAFVIRGGKIAEWRRVPTAPGSAPGPDKAEPAPTQVPNTSAI